MGGSVEHEENCWHRNCEVGGNLTNFKEILMAILSKPSGAFPIALIYITVGTLMVVWTGVAFYFYPPETNWGKFMLYGCMITGFALLAIGLLLGQIGRASRNAELPPTEVTHAVSASEQIAAENPQPVIAPTNGTVASAGPVVQPRNPSAAPPPQPAPPAPVNPPVTQV
jgi:hypothetical protein